MAAASLRGIARALVLTSLALAGGAWLGWQVAADQVTPEVAIGLAIGLGSAIALIEATHRSQRVQHLIEDAEVAARAGLRGSMASESDPESAAIAGAVHRWAARVDAAADELHTERDRFDVVLEGMAEGVLALSDDAQIVLCNRAATELLSRSRPAVGMSLVAAVRAPELWDLVAAAGAGESSTAAVDIATADGKKLHFSVIPLRRAGLRALLVVRDVTALRHLETMRRDFVANVSHELRTPVATIRAASETLLAGALTEPEAARSFADAILRHADRLALILDDLLDLARLETGTYQWQLEPVAIAERIEQAAQAVAPQAAVRGQTVSVRIEGRPIALAHRGALDQILANLLDNACKHTPDGAQIELSSTRVGESILLSVADSGPGIALHQRQRVFERFYRVDVGRSRAVGGTGLGLAIVKHLAEAMGGRVEVTANHPQGAVFCVELQAVRDDEPLVSRPERPGAAV